MALDSETRGIIESLITNNKVVLFMKGTPQQPQCGFSATTISTLNMLLPDYMTVNVLDNPRIRDGIKELSNWPTIPQLYVDGELIGGSDIVQDMLKNGELGNILGVEAPSSKTPEIQVSGPAIEVMKSAIQSQQGSTLHLQVSAGWNHTLNLERNKTGAVQADIGGIEIHLDPWSASRADGLRVELNETLTGKSFSFDNPNAPPPIKQISVQELKEKLDNNKDVVLIDVRSPEERAIASIDRALPWNDETMALVESLPKDTELIFHCQTGPRSQALAEMLRGRGYTNLSNVTDGMKAWLEEIEPS